MAALVQQGYHVQPSADGGKDGDGVVVMQLREEGKAEVK